MATLLAPVRCTVSKQVVHPFVEVQVDRRAIHQLDVRVVQRPGEPVQDPLELDRILLERRDHTGFPALRAGEHEMQGEQGLSDTRGPGDQRRGAPPVAVGEHRVQRRAHPRTSAREAHRSRPGRRGRPAGERPPTLGGQAIGVLPGEVPGAAELVDLQHPGFPFGAAVGAQRQDRVGDGELRGASAASTASYSPTQNEVTGTADSGPGQVVQEPAERPLVALVGAQGLEAVDHHQARPSVFEQIGDPGQHPGQALVVQASGPGPRR